MITVPGAQESNLSMNNDHTIYNTKLYQNQINSHSLFGDDFKRAPIADFDCSDVDKVDYEMDQE